MIPNQQQKKKQNNPEPIYRYSALLVYGAGRFDVTGEFERLDLLEMKLASIQCSQTTMRYAVALRSYEHAGRRYLEREAGGEDEWTPIRSVFEIQRHEIRVPRARLGRAASGRVAARKRAAA